jgi:DNA polymerase IIIc chi subunit
MARITIPKNAGEFSVSLSAVLTYIVSNGKSGGNRIIIPCKSREQAEKLCKKLNERDRRKELVIWM